MKMYVDTLPVEQSDDGASKALVSLVAGAGYAEYYTAPETHWIDLK